jgi:hypothetical protein
MSFQKKLEINSVKKLIDINGEIVNFEADFLVQSETLNPFYFIIADQELLDQDKELEFKYVEEGSISGKISFEKNVHTNYYMVVKADQPMIIFAQVNIKELPVKSEPPVNPQKKQVRFADQLVNDQNPNNHKYPPNYNSNEKNIGKMAPPGYPENRSKESINSFFKLIAVLAILIIGGFLIFKFYTGKDNKSDTPSFSFLQE